MSSDCSQDKFVLETLNSIRNGKWLELGCRGPIQGSNTHILETFFDWRGISIDIDQNHINSWNGVRSTEMLYCSDVLETDIRSLLEKHNFDKVIDYLSIDLEPPPITFEALKNIPFDTYKFKVITFEHDHYRNEYAAYDLMDRSRQFFNSIGYFKVPDNISSSYYTNINLSEDWYIHPELVDISEYQ